MPEGSVRSSPGLLAWHHLVPLNRCLGGYARCDAERVGVADITCSGRRTRSTGAARGRGAGRGRRRRAGRAPLILGCSGAEEATGRQGVRSFPGAVQHGGAAGRRQSLRSGLSSRHFPRQPGGRGAPRAGQSARSGADPGWRGSDGRGLLHRDVSRRAMGNEASLEGEGLPEGLAAAAGGAGGSGSALHPGIPAGMEADLSQLSEEERRQIAAVMSRAQGLPKGSVPAAAAESPSMHRHAQHDGEVQAYIYRFPCTYVYVPARWYIYVASLHFILPNGVAIRRS